MKFNAPVYSVVALMSVLVSASACSGDAQEDPKPKLDMGVEADLATPQDMNKPTDMRAQPDLTDEPDLADSSPDMPVQPVDLAFCDDLLEVSAGTLCAVTPSKTDAKIKDYAGTANRPGPGFGYHVVGVPMASIKQRGVWVHVGGSFGRPYFPRDDAYETGAWLNELMEQGFLVIQLAYDNRQSVNGDLCGRMNPGYEIDDCAGLARKEILEGNDYTTVVNVDADNGYNNRLDRLVEYLNAKGVKTPEYLQSGAVDWSQIYISGHSQGAGHAYYIAKNIGVKAACFLGGPYDSADKIDPPMPPIADWYRVPGTKTSADNMGAFVVTTDDNYVSFVGAYGIIGLTKGVSWFDAEGEYMNDAGEVINGHAASIAAPALKAQRAQACFMAAAKL